MMQGYPPVPEMELIGIISHQGTKDYGHYTAITKTDGKWTLHHDSDNNITHASNPGIHFDVQNNFKKIDKNAAWPEPPSCRKKR